LEKDIYVLEEDKCVLRSEKVSILRQNEREIEIKRNRHIGTRQMCVGSEKVKVS